MIVQLVLNSASCLLETYGFFSHKISLPYSIPGRGAVSDNGPPSGHLAEINRPTLLLKYTRVYILRLVMAQWSGASQAASKLSHTRFLRTFGTNTAGLGIRQWRLS